jgi:DNA-binding transcriptional LysR family regulator
MEIRQLTYFVEVVKRKSFSKAGEVLHITQPSISKMVKSMEDEMGVILLERSTKWVKLTDAGEIVFHHALHLIQSIENLESELADTQQMIKGHIRMGLPPMIGYNFIPKILAEFHKIYPQVTVQIREDGARRVEHAVIDGDIDLGIIVLPVDENIFESLPVVEEHLMLLVYPDHHLANQKVVALEELKEESFIFYPENFALHFHIKKACSLAGFQPNVLYESSQWDFISEMVAEKLGIAFLPESTCQNLDPTRIKIIPLTPPGIPRYLAFIWRRNAYLKFATRGFINYARSQVPVIMNSKK